MRRPGSMSVGAGRRRGGARAVLGRLALLLLTLLVVGVPALAGAVFRAAPVAAANGLVVTPTVAEDPLVGGTIKYTIAVRNDGTFPGGRAYNVDVVDVLPVGVTVTAVTPATAAYSIATDPGTGQQTLTFTNLTDLVANQTYTLTITGQLAPPPTLTPDSPPLVNTASARGSTDPRKPATDPTAGRDSGAVQVNANVLPFRLEKTTNQSTGVNQATGPCGSDRQFSYTLKVTNNPTLASTGLTVTDTLPYGVVFCSSVPGVMTATAPVYNANGTTTLKFTQATIAAPDTATIVVNVAIPQLYPTTQGGVTVNAALVQPGIGGATPVPGTPIADGQVFRNGAILSGSSPTGTRSPYSTNTITSDVTAKYATIKKTSSLPQVDYTSVVDYCLTYYTSTFYDTSAVSIVDTVPNGQDFVAGSAQVFASADCLGGGTAFPPTEDVPGPPPINSGTGTTTLTWPINTPAANPSTPTTADKQFSIKFRASIRTKYQSPATTPAVVAGDAFTNTVAVTYTATSVDTGVTSSNGTYGDAASAGQGTALPTFTKQVTNVRNGAGGATPTGEGRVLDPATKKRAAAAVGDILTFVLTYTGPANIDQKDIVVTDFLPANLTLLGTPALSGTYTGGVTTNLGCATPPCAAGSTLTFTLTGSGGNNITPQSATFIVTFDARMTSFAASSDNLGKLAGANYNGSFAYSARDAVTITGLSPQLRVTKTNNVTAPILGNKVFDYTITIDNTGSSTAYQVANLVDTLPGDIQYCANTAIDPSCTAPFAASPTGAATFISSTGTLGGTVTVGINTPIAPGGAVTVTLRVKIQPSPVIGTDEVNKAEIASYNTQAPGNFGAPITTPATGTNTIKIGGDTLAKTSVRVSPINADGRETVGDKVRITVTYTLPAQTTVYNAQIRECLPLGFRYIAGTYSGVASGAALPIPGGFATTEAGITLSNGASPCPADQQMVTIPVGSQVNVTGQIVLTMQLDARIDGKNQAGTFVFVNGSAPNNRRSDNNTANDNWVYLYTTPGPGAVSDTSTPPNPLRLVTQLNVPNQHNPAGSPAYSTNDVYLPKLELSQTPSNPRNYTQVGGTSTPPPPIVKAGDPVYFLVKLTNTGGSTAYDLGPLVDTLDSNLTPVSMRAFPAGQTPTACPAPGAPVSATGQTFTLDFPVGTTLAQGASLYACVEATVKNTAPFSTDLPNTASLGTNTGGAQYDSAPAGTVARRDLSDVAPTTGKVRTQDRIIFTLPAQVTYGDEPRNIPLGATSSGQRTITYSNSTPAVCQLIGSPATDVRILTAGTCTITATQNGDNLADPVTQNLVINKAPLTVRVQDQTREFGETNPIPCVYAAGSPTGLKNTGSYNDTVGELGTLSCTTTATNNSGLGTYPLTPGGLNGPKAGNYDITYIPAKVTITARKVTPQLDPNPVNGTLNSQVTLRAVVPVTPSGVAPTGSVQFWLNGRQIASAQLVNGVATYSFKATSAGTFPIEVRYLSTDTRFVSTGSTFGTMTITR